MDTIIKDLMIPIDEYVTIGTEATLYDCFRALEDDRAAKAKGHAHRDALVLGEDGEVLGKLTMADVYMALEPGYKSILESSNEASVLTPEYMANLFREYDLWTEPLGDLCTKAAGMKVGDVMHEPDAPEYVEASGKLDTILHLYVLGVHQPLLVREGGKVVGALRYGDVFDTIKEAILACRA